MAKEKAKWEAAQREEQEKLAAQLAKERELEMMMILPDPDPNMGGVPSSTSSASNGIAPVVPVNVMPLPNAPVRVDIEQVCLVAFVLCSLLSFFRFRLFVLNGGGRERGRCPVFNLVSLEWRRPGGPCQCDAATQCTRAC